MGGGGLIKIRGVTLPSHIPLRGITSTKFVQKLRELNKGKHIQRNFEYLIISKNVKLFFLAIIILNVNRLQY